MSRSSRGRVDPVLAGLIGATVAVGGGLVAYGSSQSADARPAPAPLEQRDDAVTARALAVVQDLASAGEDGTPSAPAAARRAAQASLRGQAVDPFRGSAKKTEAAAGGSATDAPGTAGGTATGAVTPTGPTGDATSQGGGGTGGSGSGTGDAAGSAATPGAPGAGTAPGSGPVGGGGAGSAGGAGSGSAGGTGAGSAGGSGSGPDDGGRSGTTTTPDGGVSGSPADPGVGGASDGDTAAAASRRAAALQAEAARLRRLEAERLARAPARVTLRVATTSNKRVRERLPVGGLLPNRAAAVVRVLRVARSNRVVTLRLRDGARLSGPQSPGTRCVLQVEATGQCRLVHVLVGKAAVIQAADAEGAPGPVTALRVLSVWRGDTRVFGD